MSDLTEKLRRYVGPTDVYLFANQKAMLEAADEIERLQKSNDELEGQLRFFLSTPPCRECGAMNEKDAEARCNCGGDKDDCHGCELWP